jgi:hypothetical protein
MSTEEQIAELLREADPEVRAVLAAIFGIEKKHAYQVQPVKVSEIVLESIRDAVQ